MAQSSSSRRRNPQPRVIAGISCVILSASLAGCVETAPTAEAPQPLVKPVAAKQPTGATPRGVSVALTSLTGVPEPIEAQMRDAFTAQAKERDIALGATQEPAYLIRGYVTSYPAEKGTAIAVVYDVFDGMKKRAQRIEDSVVVKGDGADPWSGFDVAAMNELAAKSADDLAAFLVATPEAMAARSSPATDTSASLASDSSRSKLSASANSPPSGLDDGQTIVQRARSTQSASAGDFSAAVLR
ncbi:conserved hypothetical protein [Methylocella tundrae]|uniref:Lipoprotein n=1 Tax=Methylocella tundrae TaxID=227605 RepID=A0A8B6M3Q4_METTU|nr:hypothetical protein [Methylocella tundrae]VTZ49049.1 conserved hypothetical protein [Methylocella tundrae]